MYATAQMFYKNLSDIDLPLYLYTIKSGSSTDIVGILAGGHFQVKLTV